MVTGPAGQGDVAEMVLGIGAVVAVPVVVTDEAIRSISADYTRVDRRLQLGEPKRAAIECELVAAPSLHIPILVDMRRLPHLVRREPVAR